MKPTLERWFPTGGVVANPQTGARLKQISTPTLFIVGMEDSSSPVAVMRPEVPGVRIAVIPNVDHLSNLANPQAFARALEGLPPAVG
ncbi:alpha/beta hydrolase [Xanthobacter sp. DSM 24535]|uniref:alpha/beta fold hydrolase n=1 Tax=Roseixanthobacter psychrophilus TaxID=3119917 RepID=UPI00372C50B1